MLTPCPFCQTPFTPVRRHLHLCPECKAHRAQEQADSRKHWAGVRSAPVHCLSCGDAFRTLAGSGSFCEDCAPARKRVVDNRRHRERSAEESDTAIHAAHIAPANREDLAAMGHVNEKGEVTVSEDPGLPGATTPKGPEIGYSTYSKEFEGWLKHLRKEASHDEWWQETPHWAFELDRGAEHIKYDLAPGPKCGGERGTRSGYLRHKRGKEAACPECTAANTGYMREYRRVRV